MTWPRGSEAPLIFLGALDGVLVGLTLPALFDARRSSALWQFCAFVRHGIYLGTLVLAFKVWPQSVTPLNIVVLHALCISRSSCLNKFGCGKRTARRAGLRRQAKPGSWWWKRCPWRWRSWRRNF